MYRDHRVSSGVPAPERKVARGAKVRFTKLAVILLAMALLGAGCGARLSKEQLAKAANGGGNGQRLSVGATGDEAGTDTGATGDQAAGGGAGATGGAGGTGAAGGTSTKSGGGGGTQAAASSCGGGGGNSDVGVTNDQITLGNVSLLTGPVPGLFKGAKDGTQAFFNYQNSLGGVCGRKLK